MSLQISQNTPKNSTPIDDKTSKENASNLKTPITPRSHLLDLIKKIPSDLATVNINNDGTLKDPGVKLLIHVKQAHRLLKEADAGTSPEMKIAMEKHLPKATQDLEKVLNILVSSKSFSSIYIEGMDKKTAESFNTVINQLKDLAPTARSLETKFQTKTSTESQALLDKIQTQFGETPSPKQNEVLKEITFLKNYQKLADGIVNDAKTKCAQNNNLKILQSEDKELLDQQTEYIIKHPNVTVEDKQSADFMNQRDTRLIEKVGKDKDPTSLVVLGAGHGLKEEIEAWNKKNPNSQIALIEITPKAVEALLNLP